MAFRPKELIFFVITFLPGFIIGLAGLTEIEIWPLAGWISIVFGFFGFLEIRVMCSHCPHYAEALEVGIIGSIVGYWLLGKLGINLGSAATI